ncbi:MAG: hypothetical protein KDA88_14720 [Planctomycetaceae bacterium]|nr:hypothetical protein [Planctomycetaceae bacterium]MCB9953606.1 hypothetical protein [Planctomycetaceae bacterium]
MSTVAVSCALPQNQTFMEKLNGIWHKYSLWAYTAIVLAHWGEHLAQTVQIYLLQWPIPQSRGVLGLWMPWLVASEALHYAYALVMLVAFWILRKGFVGRSYNWWMIAFWIQFWHHIEHALLQGQAIFHHNLFGAPVPMSIAQLAIPRVELHLFYNTAVTIPMVIAMFYHMFPLPEEESQMHCSCSWHRTESVKMQPAANAT